MTMFRRFLASGFGLMISAAFLYSINDVFLKILISSLPIPQIAFIRFLLGGIVLWPVISAQGISLRGSQIGALVLRGVFGTSSLFCILKSLTLIPLSLTMVLFYTFPIFWLGESIGKKEVALILVGLAGIYALIDPGSHAFNKGYLFGLLASCTGAMAMVMIRKARETNGAMIIYFYFCLVGGVISFPFLLHAFKWPDLRESILLVATGLAMLVGQLMMNQGFKYCKAAEGSLLLMAELVFAGVAGILFFRDPVTVRFGAGALLIIGSGLGLNWMNRKA